MEVVISNRCQVDTCIAPRLSGDLCMLVSSNETGLNPVVNIDNIDDIRNLIGCDSTSNGCREAYKYNVRVDGSGSMRKARKNVVDVL